MRSWFLLLPLFACNEVGIGFGVPPKDTSEDTGNGGIDTSIGDTTDTDADQDNDGFSPEDGDCNDADPRVSPVRDEDDEDGLDNDCDGKADEAFAGVEVAWVESSGAGHILSLDTIGRVSADVSTGSCVPYFLDHAVRDSRQVVDEWIINDNLSALARVTADGDCTQIADFSDSEVYEFPPFGVTVTPDGTMYVVFANQLGSVAEDGTFTQLGIWNADEEFFALGLANDPLTGTVGIFDAYGGFATYHATEGLVFHHMPDFSAPELSTVSGAHGDDGHWYVPAASAAGYGIFQYDMAGSTWVLQDEWADEDWSPFMLAVDGTDKDKAEFYVTASAGAFQTVWRIVHGTNHADDLYISDGSDRGTFFGIVVSDGAIYPSL